jgi:hypothetical protein
MKVMVEELWWDVEGRRRMKVDSGESDEVYLMALQGMMYRG